MPLDLFLLSDSASPTFRFDARMRLRIRFPFLLANRQVHTSVLGLIFLCLAFSASCNGSNFNTPAESIAATGGTPQSAALNTAFAAPLVATVMMGGSPVSGAFVVFTAPATGASGTFASNSSNSETDTTNASGVATSSTFTANGTIGADVVTAIVTGVTATTSFNLTNTSGPAASITATSGSLQDAQIGMAFEAPLVATVVDANQNPLARDCLHAGKGKVLAWQRGQRSRPPKSDK
jgi:hypothetical protein